MHKVYRLTHVDTDGQAIKSYVGVTIRELPDRKQAHLNEASRGGRSISPHSLGWAIREEIRRGNVPEERFRIELLEECGSVEEMLDGEERWIEALGTMAPAGYNLMPGGRSAGGPSNSKPVCMFADGELKEFPSISAAARARARELGKRNVSGFVHLVLVRIQMGWTYAEALEYDDHEDGRGTELSRKARDVGEKVATMRSREHRRRTKVERARIPRGFRLPAPDGSGGQVDIAGFAKQAELSKSTVTHRLHRIYKDIGQMTSVEVISALTTAEKRTKIVVVHLPDGQRVEGGRNELAKAFSTGEHAGCRVVPGLGYDALRTRLREAGDAASNDALLMALGVTAPGKSERLVAAEPARRRDLQASEYVVTADDGRRRRFVRQADFVRACLAGLEVLGQAERWVSPQARTAKERANSLQKRVARMMVSGTPTEIARRFGVLNFVVGETAEVDLLT